MAGGSRHAAEPFVFSRVLFHRKGPGLGLPPENAENTKDLHHRRSGTMAATAPVQPRNTRTFTKGNLAGRHRSSRRPGGVGSRSRRSDPVPEDPARKMTDYDASAQGFICRSDAGIRVNW